MNQLAVRSLLAATGISLALSASVLAQQNQYVISTVAGTGQIASPSLALRTRIHSPDGVAADADGNLFFTTANSIFKVDPKGILTRVAGTDTAGYSGDGGRATDALMSLGIEDGIGGGGLAADRSGNLYVADRRNNVVRKVSRDGVISTVAGNGHPGNSGDGGPATSAQLRFEVDGYAVGGVAVDIAGNLYIADAGNNLVRKVSSNGTITTIAANSATGRLSLVFYYDPFDSWGEPGASGAVAVDGNGNIYIGNAGTGELLKMAAGGTISTLGRAVYSSGLATDSSGNVYVSDALQTVVLKFSPDGTSTRFAGIPNYSFGYSGDGGPATAADLNSPLGLATDPSGNVYIADSRNHLIRKVAPGGTITSVAGAAPRYEYNSVAIDASGGLYVASESSLLKVSTAGSVSKLLGNLVEWLPQYYPYASGVAVDTKGAAYIAALRAQHIRKLSPEGTVTTIATNVVLNQPAGVAVDPEGNIYVADLQNRRILKISPAGTILTITGNGGSGNTGDSGPASNAQIGYPSAVAVDAAGSLYFSSISFSTIRKVSPSGTITTIAGNGNRGYSGDNGPATSAQLAFAPGIAVDADGNVYIADSGNHRIRKISAGGTITTIAGTGTPGYSGDGGPATAAKIEYPVGVAVDASGNVYVSDANNAIRVLEPIRAAPVMTSVVSAASGLGDSLAAGEIVLIRGSQLGPTILESSSSAAIVVEAGLAGRRVLFNGTPGPVLYAWANQIAAVVPFSITGSSVQVAVEYLGKASPALTRDLAASVPGIFTQDSSGIGQAAAFNQDGSLNTAENPARIGDLIAIYATGAGQMSPAGIDGELYPDSPHEPILPVTVTIGGQPAPVRSKGGVSGGVAGLLRVDAAIPPRIATGNAEIIVQVGSASSRPGVTIAVAE